MAEYANCFLSNGKPTVRSLPFGRNSKDLAPSFHKEVICPHIGKSVSEFMKSSNIQEDFISGFMETLAYEVSNGVIKDISHGCYLAEPMEWAFKSLVNDVAVGLGKPIIYDMLPKSSSASTSTHIPYEAIAFGYQQPKEVKVSLSISVPTQSKSVEPTPLMLQTTDASVHRRKLKTPRMKPRNLNNLGLRLRMLGTKTTIAAARFIVFPILLHSAMHTVSGAATHFLANEVHMIPSLPSLSDTISLLQDPLMAFQSM